MIEIRTKLIPVAKLSKEIGPPHNESTMKLTPEKPHVVMMGDSITANWVNLSGTFFADNGLIERGIIGQTSAQMVMRFSADVLALNPQVVHLMAGINDIAENEDPYDAVVTTNNLKAMVSMAKAYGIKVVMASVSPATSFAWRMELGNRHDQIVALNVWIKELCAVEGFIYCDYWPVLALPDGSLKPELGLDSVHPNAAGYAVMGPVALAAIEAALA